MQLEIITDIFNSKDALTGNNPSRPTTFSIVKIHDRTLCDNNAEVLNRQSIVLP